MDKQRLWPQKLNGLFYITFLSVMVFYGIMFVAKRMFFDFIPEVAVLWFVFTGWLLYIPLHFFNKKHGAVWIILAMILGCMAGIFLIGYSFFIILLSGLLAWIIIKVGYKPVLEGKFTELFTRSLFWFSLVLSFGMLFEFSDETVMLTIRFYALALLFFLLSTSVSSLQYSQEESIKNNFWQLWTSYNGVFWGSALALSIICLVPAFIIQFIFSLFRIIIVWIFSPFTWVVKSVPALKKAIDDMWSSAVAVENDSTLMGLANRIGHELKMYLLSDKLSFLKYLIMLLAVALLVYLVSILFRKAKDQQMRYLAVSNQKRITVEAIKQQDETADLSWWDKAKRFFRPYSSDEEHPIRKEYRQLLSLVRKQGIWKHDAMTVHQINQMMSQLQDSSPIYEKVRYGNQNLSSEEENLFRHEVQAVMQRLKQEKRE